MSNFRIEQYYNCCMGRKEPNWSEYSHLVLEGCICEGENICGGIDRAGAEFFSVYGRLKNGASKAITDIISSVDVAIDVAEKHAERSQLRLDVLC
ncbi:hypothetical protein [Kiloniella sp.]|uniref:hypothetical protein n=1 Tax=Kiloniella sp. TaxID=1938587 RepID=UPI003B019DD2